MIDQYLVAAEDKWGQQNGLVLLLPHGYEGQGPEHLGDLERFLILAAEDNISCAQRQLRSFFIAVGNNKRAASTRSLRPKRSMRQPRHIDELTNIAQRSHRRPARKTEIRCNASCSGLEKVAWDAMAERDERNAPVSIVALSSCTPSQPSRCLACWSSIRTPVKWSASRRTREHGSVEVLEHRFWRVKERGITAMSPASNQAAP